MGRSRSRIARRAQFACAWRAAATCDDRLGVVLVMAGILLAAGLINCPREETP